MFVDFVLKYLLRWTFRDTASKSVLLSLTDQLLSPFLIFLLPNSITICFVWTLVPTWVILYSWILTFGDASGIWTPTQQNPKRQGLFSRHLDFWKYSGFRLAPLWSPRKEKLDAVQETSWPLTDAWRGTPGSGSVSPLNVFVSSCQSVHHSQCWFWVSLFCHSLSCWILWNHG